MPDDSVLRAALRSLGHQYDPRDVARVAAELAPAPAEDLRARLRARLEADPHLTPGDVIDTVMAELVPHLCTALCRDVETERDQLHAEVIRLRNRVTALDANGNELYTRFQRTGAIERRARAYLAELQEGGTVGLIRQSVIAALIRVLGADAGAKQERSATDPTYAYDCRDENWPPSIAFLQAYSAWLADHGIDSNQTASVEHHDQTDEPFIRVFPRDLYTGVDLQPVVVPIKTSPPTPEDYA